MKTPKAKRLEQGRASSGPRSTHEYPPQSRTNFGGPGNRNNSRSTLERGARVKDRRKHCFENVPLLFGSPGSVSSLQFRVEHVGSHLQDSLRVLVGAVRALKKRAIQNNMFQDTHTRICVCVQVYIYLYAYMSNVCIYIYICARTCFCMCTYMYRHIHMYVHTGAPGASTKRETRLGCWNLGFH